MLVPSSPDRGEETRRRLLEAAIEVFGRKGFEASTRELATAAGVNLAAIPYHFGSKQGLYVSCADHIADRILAHVGETAQRIRGRLAAATQDEAAAAITPEEARSLLRELLETFAALLTSPESEPWARFVIREQMEPTEAFGRLYERVMGRMLETLASLLGLVLREAPQSQSVRLRAVALVGHVLIFRAARAAVMRQLAWDEIGPAEFEAIRAMIGQSLATLHPSSGEGVPS